MVRKNPNRYEWKMPLELICIGQERYQVRFRKFLNECSVRIYNGKTPLRCKITEGSTIWRICFYTDENKYWTGKKEGKSQV